VVLWSGGALGIDAAAHEGALDAGGRTVLVAGGALDAPYPACHRGLYERVEASGGTLVSLLADGHRPRPWIFLERNRLLAALTIGTVIVECPLKSGARSTAAAARHLERPVWIAAQPPWEPALALAVREEVRLGAKLLFSVDDLLAAPELEGLRAEPGAAKSSGGYTPRAGVATKGSERAATYAGVAVKGGVGQALRVSKAALGAARGAARGRGLVPEGAEQVWLALAKTRAGAHVDEICERTGLGVGQVQYELTLLVLGGWVDEALPGQFKPREGRRRGGLGFPTRGAIGGATSNDPPGRAGE
jgi:DNA processing protein